jgi:hypothetical protein
MLSIKDADSHGLGPGNRPQDDFIQDLGVDDHPPIMITISTGLASLHHCEH